MIAEILSIGTELLMGDTVDTNAAWIAKELRDLGIGVYRKTTVGDNPKRLADAYREALSRADLIIASGGLGPTRDDLTKEIAMDVFEQEGVLHEPSVRHLERIFESDPERMRRNEKQAVFPASAVVLPNPSGTAPGCILQKDGKTIVLLPGPPHEMEVVFEGFVEWYRRVHAKETILTKTLRLTGIGESDVNAMIGDLFDSVNPSLAPYAKPYEVTLRIAGKGTEESVIRSQMDALEAQVREILKEYIYGADEDTLEAVCIHRLMEKKQTVAVAESLTGGLVAARLVNVPNASLAFHTGFVVYGEDAKQSILGVREETLARHTAVSRETCEEMLLGLKERTGKDYGLATTGYAGPTGEDVGLTWIGILTPEGIHCEQHRFTGGRERVRNRAARMALTLLWRALVKEERE